jgi:phenylacetate-coenzyme A ligase PaaK-like adenylate-forming protein
MPWKKKQMAITSALLPISKIVEELNAFQPAMLGGYPTILELLTEEQKSGRLRIRPVIIMTGGEYLSNQLRDKLSEAFQCYVQTNYSCTEGGTIACECTEQHFHINDDWVIVTDDKGLSELARKFSFVIMTSSEFAKILEESITVAEGGLINDDGF